MGPVKTQCPICGNAPCDSRDCGKLLDRAARFESAKRIERRIYLAEFIASRYRAEGDDETSPRLRDCATRIFRLRRLVVSLTSDIRITALIQEAAE